MEKHERSKYIPGLVVAAVIIAALIATSGPAQCAWLTEAETIEDSGAETLGEFAAEVDRLSEGCTEVLLVDAGGRVIENPSLDTPCLLYTSPSPRDS